MCNVKLLNKILNLKVVVRQAKWKTIVKMTGLICYI